jgi:hypothetical protein
MVKLLKFSRKAENIPDPERTNTQAVLDQNRPFIVVSKLTDNRWEASCWLPESRVGFYEILGVVEQLKNMIHELYDEDRA